MKKEISELTDTKEIFEVIKQGYELICLRCKSKVNISFYIDSETKERLPSNIVCSTNENHIGMIFDYNLRKFWEELDDKWKKEKL